MKISKLQLRKLISKVTLVVTVITALLSCAPVKQSELIVYKSASEKTIKLDDVVIYDKKFEILIPKELSAVRYSASSYFSHVFEFQQNQILIILNIPKSNYTQQNFSNVGLQDFQQKMKDFDLEEMLGKTKLSGERKFGVKTLGTSYVIYCNILEKNIDSYNSCLNSFKIL